MKGALADTSVWIDLFNDVSTKEAMQLQKYIETDYPVYLCAVILQEILQGFSNDKDYKLVKDLFLSYPFLETKPLQFAVGAAELYRNLKKAGKTIRKSNDCLIAYHAIFYNIPVLHRDRDFNIMSKHSNLKVISVD
ncbi:MAG: PIN domain-containing protein [Deltaproteobacteria bacterium]|nr:PIN domain-containing protein [Deltaproteobacteria bacterium]